MNRTADEASGRSKKVDRFKQRPGRVDHVDDLIKFGPLGERRLQADEAEDEAGSPDRAEQAAVPPWATQFQLVPIETIRPGHFQVRMVEDREKDEQLREQMRADLAQYKTIQHVFLVMPDPEDSHFYNPKMGGHRRLKIAKEELGVQEVFVWIEEYNQEELARGTYAENDRGSRQDLTIVEEGDFFRRVQQRLGWTQTMIAERFHVVGGQPHVARCIKAVSYPEDIRKMLFKDPDRGMRAAEILADLDEELGLERAIEARAPLIEAFLARKLTTDALRIAVEQLIRKPLPGISLPAKPIVGQEEETVAPLSVEETARLEKATRVRKTLELYARELGEGKPSAEAREELLRIRQHIDALLSRQ